ncbi:hypothetical protein ACN4EK_20270 [Pantanalinema rosaneae CENA516]|uniref:hypothetical protein n=1 Tax=Pantanalinema rosaneae TaxID=1620701 RepID=UPI003D6F0CDB
MTTLQQIIQAPLTRSFGQLKADKQLVSEIQRKLANLGLYPGGQWIDGLWGPYFEAGLAEFCSAFSLDHVTRQTLDPTLAQKLLDTVQLPYVFEAAKDYQHVLNKLAAIQTDTPAIDDHVAFLDRTIKNSPFASQINHYPVRLSQRPDGKTVSSYGNSFLPINAKQAVTFTAYPAKGVLPPIDPQGLDFLDRNIESACLCIGSFVPGESVIRTHWLGRSATKPLQFLSATKFIPILNVICQVNALSPQCDVDNCMIGTDSQGKRYRFHEMTTDVVSYDARIASSNSLSAMFKRFTQRQELEDWLKAITNTPEIEFKGYYGEAPFLANPELFDTTVATTEPLLTAAPEVGTGNNYVSAYDLVRLMSMLGWHHHLATDRRLPAAQWRSLESLVRSLGWDTARYLDVALETLGLVNVATEPVLISKMGLGNSALTYVALAQLIDRRQNTAKWRTLTMALWAPNGTDAERDTTMAGAVTEIIRRIFAEELA